MRRPLEPGLYIPSDNRFSVKQYRDPDPDEGATLAIIENRGEGTSRPQLRQGIPLFKPPYSRMTAINLNTGEHLWMKPMGNGDRVRNHPLLRDLDLPPLGGDSSRAGPSCHHGGIPFTQVPTTGCGGVSSSDHGYP